MPQVHGKNTVVIINGVNISTHVKTSEFTRSKDTHATTTQQPPGHAHAAGLSDNAFTMSGVYDNTAGTGPRAVLQPLSDSGALVTLIRRPDGTGAGKAQDQVSVIVEKYVETNPVNDMVAWAADCKC